MKKKQHFAVHSIPSKLLTDNGSQFASKEWSFKHVTSSPYFLQSNCFTENAVNQAKSLLEKCKRDGSDPLLGLLNLRNVSRDKVLGSPAQRLMSRRTRGVLPVARTLLIPKAPNTRQVSSRLKLKRQRRKAVSRSECQISPTSPFTASRATSD